MKLLNYTTTYFSIILLVLISIWAVVFYYAMFEEIYDSIDDGLDNRKMMIINRAHSDLDLKEKPQLDEYLYTIEKVDYKDYHGFKDTYKDTLMYMINEKEFEPVRTLESVFRLNDEYYKIMLVTSMIEEDDQIENLLKYTLILYSVLVLSILLINNIFLRKVWQPFYNLLSQLKKFSLEKDQDIRFSETKIEEFNLLNKSLEILLQKTKDSYDAQKQFIENASHELQTPLAIAINKLEILSEDTYLTQEQAVQLQLALENLERLKTLNRSLLLISKIENHHFPEKQEVELNSLINGIISHFTEIAEFRNIGLRFSSEAQVNLFINPDLGYILFSNLIKNAIYHGRGGTDITINLNHNRFSISNFSEIDSLENLPIFERFQKITSNRNSTGLGLSISKSIADNYGYMLKYSYIAQQHTFILVFA